MKEGGNTSTRLGDPVAAAAIGYHAVFELAPTDLYP
jgi:hypothetical protein